MSQYKKDKDLYKCEWFTTWLKDILSERQLSSISFAKLTGISKTTAMTYICGIRSPGLKTFLLILDKLGLEMKITEKENETM